MTTPQAAAAYEAAYVAEHAGRKLAVHNPNDKPLNELPIIYGFNNGGARDWLSGVLLAEDGTHLGGHVCSSEAYMPGDLGCLEGTRDDRHTGFADHYPEGYRMQFVSHADVKKNMGLMAAISLAEKRAKDEEQQQ